MDSFNTNLVELENENEEILINTITKATTYNFEFR